MGGGRIEKIGENIREVLKKTEVVVSMGMDYSTIQFRAVIEMVLVWLA